MYKMLNKNLFIYGMLAVGFALATCGTDPVSLYEAEPIAILEPVNNPYYTPKGATFPYKLNITTDKNIDSVSLYYQIDSTNSGYLPGNPTVPVATYIPEKLSNLMTINGEFKVPTNVKYGDVVRLVVSLRAKDKNPQKQLRINIR
jgi:hypothetical protein